MGTWSKNLLLTIEPNLDSAMYVTISGRKKWIRSLHLPIWFSDVYPPKASRLRDDSRYDHRFPMTTDTLLVDFSIGKPAWDFSMFFPLEPQKNQVLRSPSCFGECASPGEPGVKPFGAWRMWHCVARGKMMIGTSYFSYFEANPSVWGWKPMEGQ